MQIELFKRLPSPWKPHDYQKKAVKFLLEHGAGALFLDPGLGKTSITLAALKLLYKAGKEDKTLIIAPLRVAHATWPGEAEKWLDFKDFKIVVLHGPNKDALLKEKADIYVINPAGLEWLFGVTKVKSPRTGKNAVSVDMKRVKALGFGTLVIDELTAFKNHGSDRFKAMKQVIGLFHRRWGLTGSPAANGYIHLFAQTYMLDQGRSFGQYITHFYKTYFTPSWNGFGWDLKPGSDELIFEKLNPLVLRMAAEDYIEMPALIENVIRVELPEKALLNYLKLEDKLIAELDEGKVVAKNAGVAMGKCRQMASGAVFLTPEVTNLLQPPKKSREWMELHDEKIVALGDLIDELQGQPLLVAYEFTHEEERLRKAFPKAVFSSDYPASKFRDLEKKWNDGEIDVLFAQPQGMSHGLNLQDAGNNVAWFTLTWDGEVYDQFIRRVRRQGNKNKRVFVHVFVADNTIDLYVWNMLHVKDKDQKTLFSGLQKYAKMRKRS
jgi:SNF2 family DNA or RNA helicase